MRFKDLSFRYKIPLRATFLVLITAVTLTSANVAREYDQLRNDLFANAESLGSVLALTLVTPLLHDDLWRAYEIIGMPVRHEPQAALGAEWLLVLDGEGRVYASTRPREHPVGVSGSEVGGSVARLLADYDLPALHASQAVELADASEFHLLMPIRFDGVYLGTLVLAYPKSIFVPRFHSIVVRGALVTLLVLAVLLPMSWYWGRRMADPLVQLADCMSRVGERIPQMSECRLYESRDEVGRAGTQLKLMLAALREKEALEQQIIASERLAAIGRITAGIAHEINNPLGGMLNAISTYKRHGQPEHATARTLPLLERGLLQIKETVAALLVEARLKSHPLTTQDLEDLNTLLQPHLSRRQVRVLWEGGIAGELALPSTQVRQILLNLLLNAVQAAEAGSEVVCGIECAGSVLRCRVSNRGEAIPAERLNQLFEPFVGAAGEGNGLGLWVTYQLVQQLGGSIEVYSNAMEGTVVTVILPLEEGA
ncbi:two-component sensor histidine kinase [Pseudothauera lacus]|uniref:histidine kinase n=1 Tax=Pseudothauera lacus TaxID=2136175 RepID=A0A2T4IFL6_9RHOO|nr:two-component sensor histidine kinase [Pseudothauera lacus]